MELKQIQRKIEDEPHGHVPNDSKSEDEQWLLCFNENGRFVFLKDVREVVEDTGNQHENVECGFKIKKTARDEKEMLKTCQRFES